jgi:muramoyltetrapeptide carboxypeptidase LdcA involved in peptidoglycan recycling
MGERGLLSEVVGVLASRPPASDHDHPGTPESRRAFRDAQREAVIDVVQRYNPEAVVCVGVPFGHTRPQWILPYGGEVTLDGAEQRVFADFG